jgi:hypothetical protein
VEVNGGDIRVSDEPGGGTEFHLTLPAALVSRHYAGAERARLWEQAVEFWPPNADYQKKTEREIPVVVLDPVV